MILRSNPMKTQHLNNAHSHSHWTRQKQLGLLGLVFLVICAIQTAPVMAISAENQKLVDAIYEGLRKVYSIMFKVVTPIAAVCVAACALTVWLGGEKGIEKAKRILLFTLMGVFIVFTAPVFVVAAHSAISFTASLPTSTLNQIPGFAASVNEIWGVAEKIVLPFAGVSIAYGGMCFFGIDLLSQLALDRQIEKGKVVIKTTIVALFAFYALPTILTVAVNTFSSSGWSPP